MQFEHLSLGEVAPQGLSASYSHTEDMPPEFQKAHKKKTVLSAYIGIKRSTKCFYCYAVCALKSQGDLGEPSGGSMCGLLKTSLNVSDWIDTMLKHRCSNLLAQAAKCGQRQQSDSTHQEKW